MKILYIDTSSSYLYTAIIENQSKIAEIKKEFGQNLSKEALPEIASMFNTHNLKPEDINKIIVVNGPGSFTGIRIGITIAKVYAWSLDKPIITISALEAMAISGEENTYHVPIIDARRDHCYTAIFNEKNEAIVKPCYISYEKLAEELKSLKEYTIVSNDQEKIPFKNQRIEKYTPNIQKIVNSVKDRDTVNPHSVNPEYLKLTEAEESKQA